MSLGERIKLLFRLFLLFTFLAAVALISAITTIKYTIQGNQETLPNLVGESLPAADEVASGIGLEVKVEDKLFSNKYAAGDIISQEPPPATLVKTGQHLHVLVSLGPPRMLVPDVVGSSARVAQILAIERGLTVGDVARVYWPDTQPDQIVAQDPPPSTTALHSPAINFLVSLGESAPAYLCPNFAGMRLAQIRSPIQRSGFTIAKVSSIPGGAAASGTILDQSPAPGSKIISGDSFAFQVAQ
ncbi:MAG: PASTA domain-containing protein [Terriglobia bacterium]